MPNVDGFVRFGMSEDGTKAHKLEVKGNTIDLDEYFNTYYTEDIDELIDLNEVLAIRPDIKNCLLLVTFSYKSVPSFDGEFTEYEDVTTVKDVLILNTEFKELWRSNLTAMYGFAPVEELQANGAIEDICEWEEFYEEDYEHVKPVDSNLTLMLNAFKASHGGEK